MKGVNHDQRACAAWPVVVQAAAQNDTITYGRLAEKIGIHRRALKWVLGLIQDFCLRENLPPLTILVVKKGTDVPSTGFIAFDTDRLGEGRQSVCDFNWAAIPNPFSYASDGTTLEQLAETLIQNPSAAEAVYRKLESRGIAQILFRRLLMRAYDSKCAFCEFSFDEALEAAHIIGWSVATSAQRIDITNGLLLCATHHSLFDCGLLTLTRSFRISFVGPAKKRDFYSTADKFAALELHGKLAFLPGQETLRPSLAALAHHHCTHDLGDLP